MNIRNQICELESEISHLNSKLYGARARFGEQLDQILEILNKPKINQDRITSTHEDEYGEEFNAGPEFVIETYYTLRCCDMYGEHRIPMSIMDAEDPLEAARQFMIQKAENERLQEEREQKAHRESIIEEYNRIIGEQA